MAEITEIEVSFEGLIPTQDYGSVKLKLTWKGELLPTDNPDEVTVELFDKIRQHVVDVVTPIASKKATRIDRALAKLPARQRAAFEEELGPAKWILAVEEAPAEKEINDQLENER